jgi:enamine deaminase RidA (YjgF/YER057c/UK114 family)
VGKIPLINKIKENFYVKIGNCFKKIRFCGAYSHGIDLVGLIFLSGQNPIDPIFGKLVEGYVKEQT